MTCFLFHPIFLLSRPNSLLPPDYFCYYLLFSVSLLLPDSAVFVFCVSPSVCVSYLLIPHLFFPFSHTIFVFLELFQSVSSQVLLKPLILFQVLSFIPLHFVLLNTLPPYPSQQSLFFFLCLDTHYQACSSTPPTLSAPF